MKELKYLGKAPHKGDDSIYREDLSENHVVFLSKNNLNSILFYNKCTSSIEGHFGFKFDFDDGLSLSDCVEELESLGWVVTAIVVM